MSLIYHFVPMYSIIMLALPLSIQEGILDYNCQNKMKIIVNIPLFVIKNHTFANKQK